MPTAISSQDAAGLDNPVYAALSGAQARFVQRSGRALRYHPSVAPFLAVPSDASSADWQDAVELVPPGTIAGILHAGSELPGALAVADVFELVQMIGDRAVGADDPEAVTLGPDDVPEMLRLVQLTEPGPF